MVNSIKKAMNTKYRDVVNESNILDDLENDDSHGDPLSMLHTSDQIVEHDDTQIDQPTIIVITKFTTMDIYKFFGAQILMGLADLRCNAIIWHCLQSFKYQIPLLCSSPCNFKILFSLR